MKYIDDLLGQPVAKKMFTEYLKEGVLPPLLILNGPDGTGKWSAAESFIKQMMCEVGTICGSCPGCRKIMAGEHPDYIRFPEERIMIGTETNPLPFTVRWLLQNRVCYTPFSSTHRYILFPRADLIQNEAETALLKTLEEPPEHTRFLFLVRSLEDLKPTIVSRGVSVPFQLLSEDVVRSLATDIPEDFIEILGGTLHLVPFLRTQLFKALNEKVINGCKNRLMLLDLESWIQSSEKSFKELLGGEEYNYNEILEVFSLLMIYHLRKTGGRDGSLRALFRFKDILHKDMPGMNPYSLGQLFHSLEGEMAGRTITV